ncbi:MAG: fatty-acid oxidation protein subunit alpha [Cyanobacteria bacterium]|nr:fatty-acid oxidation protein subunit alpha [Cyanobacteriota bacterium]
MDRSYAVCQALLKEGWTITDDPLYILVDDVRLSIDSGSERILGASKSGQTIAVEIKSFPSNSDLSAYHLALGQFLNYRLALKRTNPERILYLAISQDIYQEFFIKTFIQDSLAEYSIKLIIIDLDNQEIVLWKE